MPKILISPGFGAGWSTWIASNREQSKFLLTYTPFIEALEQNSKNTECILRVPEVLAPLIPAFLDAWKKAFPEATEPYLGGLCGLKVVTVYNPFKLKEFDGNESIDYGDADEWYEV